MSTIAILEAPEYAGIRCAIRPSSWEDASAEDQPAQDEIDDDIEGEKETLDLQELPGEGDVDEDKLSASGDDSDSDSDGEREDSDGDAKMADLRTIITEASKGVTDDTDAEYKRIIKLCEKFVHVKGFIKEGRAFFTNTPHTESAAFIVAWIMDR
ncbi:hypothetical protein B0H10DRAFT_2214072 [Mycena sp. CBHHK59/15]|nr:hypothetical protein B0H10DRAFT_2214072 [Mycena sp. CBHHK59/15]